MAGANWHVLGAGFVSHTIGIDGDCTSRFSVGGGDDPLCAPHCGMDWPCAV
ncbi:Uncharacterised protein [Vibrio cholerae]|nr:Uncharacterised protein [Vibrio cholerae]